MDNKRRYIININLLILVIAILLSNSSTATATHFFQKNSTWYEKIPENPEIYPNSEKYVNDILINSKLLATSFREWSVPVFRANENDPIVQILDYYCVKDGICEERTFQKLGWDYVPLPANAKPAGNDAALACWPSWCRDGHMVIISADGRYAWDISGGAIRFPDNFQDPELAGKVMAKYVRRWDLTGDGINSPYDGMGAARLAPVPLLHGLITYEEIVNQGKIDHALAFTYNGNKKSPHWGIYPAEKYNAGINDREWALIEGMRLQLDPSVDCNAIARFEFERIVCVALQEYGMILVDNSGPGNNNIIAESLEDKPESWQGIIIDALRAIPLDKLRVVKPIYPSTTATSTQTDIDTVPPQPPQNVVIE